MRILLCLAMVFLLTIFPLVQATPHIALSNDVRVYLMENDGNGVFRKSLEFIPRYPEVHEISSGDFDRDGNDDMVVTYWHTGAFSVFWGLVQDGRMSFAEEVYPIEGGSEMHAIGVGDFNNDGLLDIAPIDNGQNRGAVIILNQGNRQFRKHALLSASGNLRKVEIADLNNDGNTDIAIPDAGGNTLFLFYGDGTGGFKSDTKTIPGISLRMVDSGDIDGDGDLDLAVANSESVTILENDGNGGFAVSEDVKIFSNSFLAVKLTDFDKDGIIDMVATKSNGLFSWKGTQEKQSCPSRDDPNKMSRFCKIIEWNDRSFNEVIDIEVEDFNSDGNLDVASGALESNRMSGIDIFLGNGDLSFSRSVFYLAGQAVGSGGIFGSQTMISILHDSGGPAPKKPEFMRGDVDGDGKYTMGDAVFLLNFLFVEGGKIPQCLDAADIDDNGALTLGDAITLLNYLFVPGSKLPAAPYGTIGTDPTEDSLGCESYGT